MKIFNRLPIIISSVSIFGFSLVAKAADLQNAFGNGSPLTTVADKAKYNKNLDITQVIGIVINSLLGMLGVIFMLLIIYAGVNWMMAEGDEARVEKAQRLIKTSIIGLIIVISAYAISYFILGAISQNALAQ